MYVHNSAIHVLAFSFSINIVIYIHRVYFENVNDVVCLSFLSNEGYTYILYNNDNDTIETLVSFVVTEDKTIVDKKKNHNLKHQVADNLSK